MPWCEECARYWTPNATNDDGTCPTCGEQVVAPDAHGVDGAAEGAGDERAPWHFKLMIVAVVAYLAWRIVDLVN